MRVLTTYPQEARLLAIDFEETSAYHQEQADKQERSGGSGRTHSNLGDDFEADGASIGDDDEVDWLESERDAARGASRAEEGTG